MNNKNREKIIKVMKPNPSAACRLFCFAYAGGSASIFKEWSKILCPHVEIYAIQMPGRESRIGEKPYEKLGDAVDEIISVWDYNDNKPFAFFGHSLGAIISFETARKLSKKNTKPDILFISGCEDPRREQKDPIHHLPDNEFIQKIKEMGGTPDLIFQSKELLELFMPVLRADFTMIETYQYEVDEPLDTKMVVYGGSDDRDVDFNLLTEWRDHTTSDFRIQKIWGGHFFLKESVNVLLKDIKYHLQSQLILT